MVNIISGYRYNLLESIIRDNTTSPMELRDSLFELGQLMGEEMLGSSRLISNRIITPMLAPFLGKKLSEDTGITVVISTKDDYVYFANGIAKSCKTEYRGYIDFAGSRGSETLSGGYREIVLPEITSDKGVQRVIIAKSVVASGCTAISLARVAFEKYMPNELIIVAPFYSQSGIDELKYEFKNSKIFVAFGPDELDADGMLLPGVGDLDKRLA